MTDSTTSIHVHRGKLSKACRRCRDKRLRCDLQRPNCSPCIRAKAPCTGYRNTESIRFNDQTEAVRSKLLIAENNTYTRRAEGILKAHHLPQDLQVLGRNLFFSYYVAEFSRTWEFLYAYQDAPTTPEHLTLLVDAVSLAFLSHQVSSQTARDLGMRKYGTALKKFTRTMQDPNNFCKPSTLESVLLFDLFEKIMKPDSGLDYSNTHIQGALALVKLRGIEQFNEPKEVKALMGLALSATINSLCLGDPIPEAVRDIRKHAAQFVDTSYPKWKLSGVILDVTDTPAEMLFSESRCSSHPTKSIELDKKLEEIALEAGPAWTYERNFISGHDPRRMVPDNFFPVYDVYPNRTITQMYNVLRLSRILLCEQVIDDLSSEDDECAGPLIERAKLTITAMIREILASVPQMTNCDLAAKQKLPKDSLPDRHTHTMSHILDVYILIYPLYIVAWSQNCPPTAREWTMSQLRHISEHFGIKEASYVIDILRQRDNQGEIIDGCIDMAESVPESSTVGVTSHPFGKQTDIGNPCSKPCGKTRADPWVVYRLLGSYAFAAA